MRFHTTIVRATFVHHSTWKTSKMTGKRKILKYWISVEPAHEQSDLLSHYGFCGQDKLYETFENWVGRIQPSMHGVCVVGCLLVCVLTHKISKISLDLKNSKWEHVSHHSEQLWFFDHETLPLHPQNNHWKTPDWAWCKFGSKFFLKIFCSKFCSKFFFFYEWKFIPPEQKVIQIQNALQEIATLFVTTYKLQKFHQISKFLKPKCVLGHSEQLWFFHPGPPPPCPLHHHQKWENTRFGLM